MKGKGEEELGRDLHVWARAVENHSLGRSLLGAGRLAGTGRALQGLEGRVGLAHGAEGHRRTTTEGSGCLPTLPARDACLLACVAPGCG